MFQPVFSSCIGSSLCKFVLLGNKFDFQPDHFVLDPAPLAQHVL